MLLPRKYIISTLFYEATRVLKPKLDLMPITQLWANAHMRASTHTHTHTSSKEAKKRITDSSLEMHRWFKLLIHLSSQQIKG